MVKDSSSEGKLSKRSFKNQEIDPLDSLPWRSSLPEENSFPLFIGSNDLEGGFLTLEEIDESEYGLDIEDIDLGNERRQKLKRKSMSKEHSISNGNDEEEGPVLATQTGIGSKLQVIKDKDAKNKVKKQKKEKKSKPNKKTDFEKNGRINIIQGNANSDGINGEDNDTVISEENPVDEEEYCAWNELRLHPIIMKSIYRLKFKEPTPIQKICIPAAAHQGKDIIGAAETGSGKTLAFGLPIMQRLLDEREKVERLMANKGEVCENISPRSVLRALIVTPTRELARQVTDHITEVARGTGIRVVTIIGGMSSEKQERLLKTRPEIVVGTPGRLYELMSGGETHLVELRFLSFFVLDEADRMIEHRHFSELQSIIDMLPKESSKSQLKNTENCVTSVSRQLKKRQTLLFSATLSLSAEFRRNSKHRTVISDKDGFSSIETLSKRAGVRENKEIVDLTNSMILPGRLVQSVIWCQKEEKDAYLCYILSIHGQGRTIVFCTSIAALRHISSFLCILNMNIWTLHREMGERERLKSLDRFRASEDGILVATDCVARGLDIFSVRTVVHYQLPHTRDVYVHRCGRTARSSTDGCSIALISPNDASTFADINKSFAQDGIQRFPIESSYMPEIMKRSSLAHQIDKIALKDSKDKAEKTWWKRNAKSVELDLEDDDSDEETVKKHRQRKVKISNLDKLQQELSALLSRPLQPKTLSKRFLAGAGVSPLLQRQFGELTRQKLGNDGEVEHNKRRKLVVIGQDLMEPLEALKKAGDSAILDLEKIAKNHKNADNLRRKRKEMKKRMHEQRRKQRKMLKQGGS